MANEWDATGIAVVVDTRRVFCAWAMDGWKKSRRDIVKVKLLKATLAKEAGNAETTESSRAKVLDKTLGNRMMLVVNKCAGDQYRAGRNS